MIVKDFVSAYLSGQIKLRLPNAEEIMTRSEIRGKSMDYDEAYKTELRIKNKFSEKISICAGVKKTSKKKLATAISDLFNDVISLRNGHRIEGVFTEYSLEARIKRLEEGMDKVNNLVREIVDWIFRGVVDK